MPQLLMPKATAVWLIDHSGLTFQQIADFCGLHPLEVQAIADGEVAVGIIGQDPVAGGQITKAELERGEADPNHRLQLANSGLPEPAKRAKGPRYTPVSRRADKPDAIAWLLRNHPELSDALIGKMIGTTVKTIQAVRDRTHENSANIKPRSPVQLGLCTQAELDEALARAAKRGGKPAGDSASPGDEPETPAETQPEAEETATA
jgi:hypothetical protein